MLPLVAQRLVDYIAVLYDSVADVLPHCWHALRQLHRDACDNFECMTYVATAAREEEARCKAFLFVVPARHCLRNGRLTCARQPAQPEDAPLILAVRPAVYLVEESDAGVGEAGRIVLLGERVEGRVGSARQLAERVLSTGRA